MQATHADIEGELHRIFAEHPDSDKNESGEPTIPADALVDVFRAFSDLSNGPLLSPEETEMLKMLLANNPGLEVTPGIILQFIAEKTRHSPSPSPDSPYDSQDLDFLRGRNLERSFDATERSSSNESNSASHYTGSRPPSRGPMTPHSRSVFDMERRQRSTPLNNAPSSWAGKSKRPAPASRRRSVDGRLSDSEYSDGPSAFSRSISGRTRSRAPSNPVSPSESFADLSGSFSPIGSPSFSSSLNRPHSRAGSSRSQSFSFFGSPNFGDDSIDDENTISNALLNTSGEYRSDDSSTSFKNAISSLPMPSSAVDSDSDDEQDSSFGLVMERDIVSSNASMEPLERLDALQRQNAELARKCMEAERTLQNRLAEHESELEEMQGKLEEMRSELSATKREEKELRSKERQNTTQISALELEVSKVTKALEHSKATYTSLQRQYQEQCSASEKYRSDLRAREDLIRSLREASSLHDIEVSKWVKEQQTYEDRIALLQEDLSVAQGVYVQLDEQKQENLMLKETIDRMRFEMDEMRANAALGLLPLGNASSATVNSLSKTLGAELMGKMKWDEGDGEGEDEKQGDEEEVVEGGTSLDSERSEGDESLTVFEEDGEDEDDVIQTIITRKKRKVASRAQEFPNPSSRHTAFTEMQHEELKEYSDMGIQYDPTLICVSSGVQTVPPPIIPTSSLSIQTDPPPTTRTYAIQTASPPEKPKKVTMEIEIQTDTPDIDATATLATADPPISGEESLASSSSTILPPTPKQRLLSLSSSEDEPPTYNQVAAQRLEEEKERKRVNDVLTRWHLGAKLRKVLVLGSTAHAHAHSRNEKAPRGDREEEEEEEEEEGGEGSSNVVDELDVEGIEGGIPEDLVEEWKALKAEMGVECGVIDKILEHSTKIPPRASTTDAKEKGKRRSGRFYNIYNTYVYGGGSSSSSDSSTTDNNNNNNANADASSNGRHHRSLGMTFTNLATQSLLFVSASAVVFVALTPYIPYLLSAVLPGSHDSHVPGGPTSFDRQAWQSYNTLGGGGGEGFTFAAATQRGAKGLFGGWMGLGGVAGIGVGAVHVGGGGGGGGDGVGADGVVTDAVWRVLGRVGGGAARIARGWPT